MCLPKEQHSQAPGNGRRLMTDAALEKLSNEYRRCKAGRPAESLR